MVRACGTADLIKEVIDMKIKAQVSQKKALVINVKGPLSEPSYKIDLLSSVASLLGKDIIKDEEGDSKQSITELGKNAGKIIKNIGGLFKK